jgi:short-subunit dehydrogenase
MGKIRSFRGLGCLVTGASAGIGLSFARLLAAEGARVVVTARRLDRLEALAEELERLGAPEAFAVAEDLSDPDAPARLAATAESLLGHVDVLVNNAGFSVPGRFARSDLARTRTLLHVNVLAATELMRRLLPGMLERDRGGIVTVSSLAGYQATAFQAAYAASKAYLLVLSESVHMEVRGTGVSVTTLSPGTTDTEFFEAAGYRHLGPVTKWRMDPDRVARVGLRGLRRGRLTVVPGVGNRILNFLPRLFTRRFVGRVTAWLMGGRVTR